MKMRFEIRDTHNPAWRGQRFSAEDRARKEFAQCVGAAGRWELYDREHKTVLARSEENL